MAGMRDSNIAFPKDMNNAPVAVLAGICQTGSGDIITPVLVNSDGKISVDTELVVNATLTITNLDIKPCSTDQSWTNRKYIECDSDGQIYTHSYTEDGVGTAITSTVGDTPGHVGLDVVIAKPFTIDVQMNPYNDGTQIYGYDGLTLTQIKTNAAGDLKSQVIGGVTVTIVASDIQVPVDIQGQLITLDTSVTGGNGVQAILAGLTQAYHGLTTVNTSIFESNDESGTVTSGGASTLTDTTKNWAVNILAYYTVKIISGAGAGQFREIASNTSNVITTKTAWNVQPVTGDKYIIMPGISDITAEESGLATAGGASTLTDTTKDWLTNLWINYNIRIIAGTGIGQTRRILSNTTTIVTTTSAWTTPPDTTSKYVIWKGLYTAITNEPAVVLKYIDGTTLTGADWTQLFQNTSGALSGISQTLAIPNSPTIQNFVFPTANTWTQLTPIASSVKSWLMRGRTSSTLYYNYSSISPSAYMTLDAGATLNEDTNVSVNGLYVSAAVTNTIVELETWR